jgi:hypothetical protein
MMSEPLETALWENVQRAYAASRSYRAGNDPDYAKALAEYERVALKAPKTNVIPFKRRGVAS